MIIIIIIVMTGAISLILLHYSHYKMSELTGHKRGKNIIEHIYRPYCLTDLIVMSDFINIILKKKYDHRKEVFLITLLLFMVGLIGFIGTISIVIKSI